MMIEMRKSPLLLSYVEYDKEDSDRMVEHGSLKDCSKCSITYPRSYLYFHRNRSNKDGLTFACQVCRRKDGLRYIINNKDKRRAYREANKEVAREYFKQYYIDNREELIQYQRDYTEENRERITEAQKEYYWANRKQHLERMAIYRKRNPEAVRRGGQRRKARENNMPYTLTVEEWEESLNYFDFSCIYCGVSQGEIDYPLQQEHIIPVVLGGGYVKENIAPSCQPCNSSKHARVMEEWFKERESFTEERLTKINKWAEGVGVDD